MGENYHRRSDIFVRRRPGEIAPQLFIVRAAPKQAGMRRLERALENSQSAFVDGCGRRQLALAF